MIQVERDSRTAKQGYVVPEGLFSGASQFPSRPDLRDYVLGELVKMAAEKTLSITHLHNLHPAVMEAAGMCILGQAFDEHAIGGPQMVTGQDIPDELMDYRVTIRGREAKKDYAKMGEDPDIKTINSPLVKDGKWVIRWKVERAPIKDGLKAVERANTRTAAQTRYEDVWHSTGETEATLRLRDAWKVLHQYGMHCKNAPTQSRRDSHWRYVEVRPSGISADDWHGAEPVKAKRGRPKGS